LACATLASISPRNSAKSIGLVTRSAAPLAIGHSVLRQRSHSINPRLR
jgi:hypothetical protein